VSADWWQSFFSGLAVEMWLQATPEEVTRSEVDYLTRMLQVSAPARLLDVPCGGGHHSRVLAALGYRMTGVDMSDDFLKAARSHPSGGATPVLWEQRDMRDLPWPQTFDGAFCWGNSFSYFDDAGNATFLKAVHGALKPGARFVLDTGVVAEALLSVFQERAWHELGNIFFLQDRQYDPARSRVDSHYTLIRDGKVERCSASYRIYGYAELCRLLGQAGFEDIQGYGSLAGEPFRLGSKRALFVATKPK
jgi:SAM-dependent methyltransferase